MKASELRIGNLVKLEGISRPIKVSIIDTTETSTNTKYKPIPLTEEWLVKLGFDFNNNDYFLSKKGFDICFEKQGCLLKCFLDSIEIDIKHVHTLQNLYFALIGQELTIKTEQQ